MIDAVLLLWVQVLAFLSPSYPAWDLTLAFVMGGALLVALPGFQAIQKGRLLSRPYCGESFMSPAVHTIDAKLVAGGLLFGAGWGLTGMCPGPAVVAAVARPSQQVLAFLGSMLLGLWLEGVLAALMAKPSCKGAASLKEKLCVRWSGHGPSTKHLCVAVCRGSASNQ